MSETDRIKANFLQDTENHTLQIEHDDGLFRHLVFSNNGSSVFRFAITTWPGYLAISGDMCCFVFARVPDMLKFFRQDDLTINSGYWLSKLVAPTDVKEFDAEASYNDVSEYLKERADDEEADPDEITDLRESVKDCQDEREFVEKLADSGFEEPWEFIRARFKYHAVWCLFAIVKGIQMYDAAKEGKGDE